MAVNRCKGWIIGGVVPGIAVVVAAAVSSGMLDGLFRKTLAETANAAGKRSPRHVRGKTFLMVSHNKPNIARHAVHPTARRAGRGGSVAGASSRGAGGGLNADP